MLMIPSGDDEGKYTIEFRRSLLRGLLDIKNGRIHSSSDVKKMLRIES